MLESGEKLQAGDGVYAVNMKKAVALFRIGTRPLTDGIDAFFEAISAFATTGLSAGVTARTGLAGQIALVLAMYIGRVGPVCFIIALNRSEDDRVNEVLPEGRIMVG